MPGAHKHRKKRVYRRGVCADCGKEMLACNMWGDRCDPCYRKLTPEQIAAETEHIYSLNGIQVTREEFEKVVAPFRDPC